MTVASQPQQQTKLPPSKMALTKVVKGRQAQPLRVVLYGVEGIGKSTFGASAPSPIFLGAEDGTAHLDVARFPTPETWADVLEAARVLERDEHDYRTLVLDTLDWVEPVLWRFICARDGKADIEAYGYGKGYVAALDEWRAFLAALERVWRLRKMHVVLLAHSWIRPFHNPEGPDFDRYEMKLHVKAGGLIREWADDVLFANYETFAHKDEKTKRVRGVDTGARLIYTQRRASYDAKNRHGLPESLPLSWVDFVSAVEAGTPAYPADLKAEILRKAKELGPELERAVADTMAKAGDNATSLALINNRVNARLADKAAAEQAQKAS